jgi:hypothetical protein
LTFLLFSAIIITVKEINYISKIYNGDE